MINSNFKIVKIDVRDNGRCVKCEAKKYCTYQSFKCECKYDEHYINIKFERKEKLNKLNKLCLK